MSYEIEVFRQDFSDYADDAAFLAAWAPGTEGAATAVQTWDRSATHVVAGETISAHVNVTGTATVGDVYKVTLVVPGMAPGRTYSFRRQAYATEIVAGLPANQFNQLTGDVVADGSGNVELVLRFTTPAGGTFDVDIWFGDVHLVEVVSDADLEHFTRDAGRIYVNGAQLAVTVEGVSFDPQRVYEQDSADGVISPQAGGDVLVGERPIIRAAILQLGPGQLLAMEPGSVLTGDGDTDTVTPVAPGTTIAAGDLLATVVGEWDRLDGGFLRVAFPLGKVARYSLPARDKDEVRGVLEIEARGNGTDRLYTLKRVRP